MNDRQRIPGITTLPAVTAGMRIGLFGGSFNPPHEGHRLVALQCLQRLGLDAIWLLVSPGNPLKDHSELAGLAERVTVTRTLMDHPQIAVTGFEAEHGFRYSYDTLHFLTTHHAAARFVWIMGSDNLIQFHHWDRWQDITRLLPIAVYARPGSTIRASTSVAAEALRRFRLPEHRAEELASRPAPAWVYLHGVMSPQSSTALRARHKSPT